MSGDRERNAYRAVVFAVLIAGALGFFWYLGQGGEGLGEGGIFRFFSDPASTPAPPVPGE